MELICILSRLQSARIFCLVTLGLSANFFPSIFLFNFLYVGFLVIATLVIGMPNKSSWMFHNLLSFSANYFLFNWPPILILNIVYADM